MIAVLVVGVLVCTMGLYPSTAGVGVVVLTWGFGGGDGVGW